MQNNHKIAVFLAAAALLLAACGGGKGGTNGNDVYWPDTGDQETAGGNDSVTGEAAGDNQPPVLFKIGDKSVAAGSELVITLKAEDPDGDGLSFNVYGSVPPSAKLLKESGEFRWTPEAQYVGQSLFLTFVATDGRGGYDRETVEIAVTAQGQNHAPKFQAMGDQAVQAGKHAEFQLVATDPDSDPLTYAIQGTPPAGSALDSATGRFTWDVPAGTEGQAFPVTFSVSDGTLTDSLAVRFVVAGGSGNHAPTFQKMDEVKATAGKPVSFTVNATDADQDPLTYGVEEDTLPAGAQFDAPSHSFSWTPSDAQAGKAWQVAFHVDDGTYSAFLEVTIVVAKAVTSACQVDSQEPNDSAQAAKAVQAGTLSGLTLCPQEGQPDVDVFAVTLPKDARLTARSHAAQAGVNLDLEVAARPRPVRCWPTATATGPTRWSSTRRPRPAPSC
jgi:hypothetical protein